MRKELYSLYGITSQKGYTMSLQVHKDVLDDIKESKLSKEEKLIEEDRALDARQICAC